MARPLKNGLDYFPMDVDFFSDIKIRKLIKFQGAKAIAVYSYLLCIIYKNGYYCEWDNDLPFIISEVTGYNEAYISEVIKSCFDIGILHKGMYEKHQILTSKGIQTRYKNVNSRSKSVKGMENYILIKADKKPINATEKEVNVTETQVNVTLTPLNVAKSAQKKEKEKKENKTKEKERKITHAHVIIKNEKYIPIGDLPRHANLSLPISSSFFNFNTKDKKIFKVTNKHIATMTAKFTNLEVTLILARYRMFLERNPDKLVLASEFLDNLRDRFRDWDVEALEFPQFSGKKSLSYAKFEGYFEFKTKDNNTVRIDDSEVNKLQEDYPNIDVVAKLNNYKGYLEDNEDRRPRKENLMKNITEKFEAWNAEAEEKTNRMKIKAEEHIPDYNNPYFRLRHNIN